LPATKARKINTVHRTTGPDIPATVGIAMEPRRPSLRAARGCGFHAGSLPWVHVPVPLVLGGERRRMAHRDADALRIRVAACKRCDAGLQTAALLGPRSLRIRRHQGSQSLHMGQQSLQTACKQRTSPTGIANSALRDRLSKKKAMVYLIGEISSDLNEDLRG